MSGLANLMESLTGTCRECWGSGLIQVWHENTGEWVKEPCPRLSDHDNA